MSNSKSDQYFYFINTAASVLTNVNTQTNNTNISVSYYPSCGWL